MATLSGTQVIAKIVTVDSLDTYPTHDELYGKGGYRTVATTIVRDAIPADRRSVGMLVYVTADSHFYTLDANLTSWTDKGDLTGGAFASQAEAEAGTNTTKYMNPLRAAQALLARIIAGTNVTKTPVAGGVQLDASATGSMEYVFWQTSPTQTGVLFNDWEDMCAAILALPNGVAPFITFKENFTIPLVNMPVGGWDMRGAAWESPLIATGNVTITIPDGVLIDNLVSIEQGLAVECNPTTTDGVFLHSAYAGLQILVVDFGANLYNLGSKALIDQTGQVVIALNGASTIGAGPANVGPWVKANTANTVLAIMIVASGSTGFPDGWIVGGVPGSVLLYQHGITFTDPVITWAGDAPIYLNSSQAKNLPYDNGASGLTATQVQAAIDELASGGGGGSAYPDNFYIESVAGTTNLTTNEQGFVSALVSGVTFELPTTAPDGTMFKFTNSSATYTVSSGTKFIITYGATSFKLSIGMRVDIVAYNIDLGGGLDLYWFVVNTSTLSLSAWDSTIRYLSGQMVTRNGEKYIAVDSSSNFNEDPETSAAFWLQMPNGKATATLSGTIDEADLSFVGTAPPTSFSGSAFSFKSVYGLISILTADFEYGGTGTDVTQITIALGNIADANPAVSMLPSLNTAGVAFVNATEVVCRYVAASRSIVINLPVSGITGTLAHAKIVF